MLEDFPTMTRRHVGHWSHTTAVREIVKGLKTKLDTIEGSGDVQQFRLYNNNLKDQSLVMSVSFFENIGLVDQA